MAPAENSPPPVEVPGEFSRNGTVQIPDRWWQTFADEQLDALVTKALESNFDLQTAWSRLREARAVVARESGARYPEVDASLSTEKKRSDSTTGLNTFDDDEIRFGLVAEYELDLWGRISSQIEASRFLADASHADYQAAAVSLSAEVARTWFQWLEARNELDLFIEQLETNEKVLEVLRARFGAGLTRTADILRQQLLVESTREQQLATESRMQILEHQMAVLLGEPPQKQHGFVHHELPEVPPLPSTGLPAELVQRRPDVRAAFYRLRAADRDVAAAVSEQYPRLTLSASASTVATDPTDLFRDWVRSLSAGLLGPVFDGGRRGAEADRTREAKARRLSEYGQVILESFREVEDALVQERKQAQQIGSLVEQVRLARQTHERLQDEYLNGVGDYIDMLIALTDEQRLRRDLLRARGILLEFRIGLYRALAGGFTTTREAGE